MLLAIFACARPDVWALSVDGSSELVVRSRSSLANRANTSKLNYERDLLALALEKTRLPSENFIVSDVDMVKSSMREMRVMKKHEYKHFIRSFSVTHEMLSDPMLAHIKFPIARGVYGYRVCLVEATTEAKLATLKTVEQFKELTHIQGYDWIDTTILKAAGFKVYTTSSHNKIAKMIHHGRADLYCVSLIEAQRRKEASRAMGFDLIIDKKYMMQYFQPRFFFANVKDKAILQRVEQGLKLAVADGSFLTLWKRYFSRDLEILMPGKRHIVPVKNSLVDSIKLICSDCWYQVDENTQ